MTFEVQQTRWDRMIRRVSGSIGPGSRLSETLSELFPVFDVEQAPAELLVLGGTRMAHGFSNEPAVADVIQHSQLFNPVDSGSLITLLYIAIRSNVSEVAMGLIDGAFTTSKTNNVAFVDGRLFGSSAPVGQVRHETAGAPGPESFLLNSSFFNVTPFAPPKAIAVLSPGIGFQIHTLTVNGKLDVSYTWLERQAEQSELSL